MKILHARKNLVKPCLPNKHHWIDPKRHGCMIGLPIFIMKELNECKLMSSNFFFIAIAKSAMVTTWSKVASFSCNGMEENNNKITPFTPKVRVHSPKLLTLSVLRSKSTFS